MIGSECSKIVGICGCDHTAAETDGIGDDDRVDHRTGAGSTAEAAGEAHHGQAERYHLC